MSAHIVAMGADRALMEQPDDPLHDFVLGLAESDRPRVGFVPTASGDDASYIVAFYETYNAERCRPSHLKLFYRDELDLRRWVMRQEVIHVGGGNTANMLDVWRRHGIDELMREAWEAGKVLCGGSAGALCWFEGGVTDSFGTQVLQPLRDGLGLLEGSMCPHYDVDALRAPAYRDFVGTRRLPAGYATDDQVALHFQGNRFVEALTSREGGCAYYVDERAGSIEETPLKVTRLVSSRA